jgi:hypothetical protein
VPRSWVTLSALFLAVCGAPLLAQQPFYTDDSAVTEQGVLHFEFFNEFDLLQHQQYPSLRQNTVNYKVNYGLPHHLELDLDSPYLAIFRALAASPRTSKGIGDTNLGIKWNFHQEATGSRTPAFSVTFYVEFPTGDSSHELGSGLTDYWLNFIAQKHLSKTTRLTSNLGIVFAGNTSTGLIGIQTKRARVYTGGLSLLHDFNDRWTVGTEVYGGFTDNSGLGRRQLQILLGGQYSIRNGLTLDFGVLGGKYTASPRVGAQLGFSVDFPAALK